MQIHAPLFPRTFPARTFAAETIANYDPSLCDIRTRPGREIRRTRSGITRITLISPRDPIDRFEIPARRMQFGVFVCPCHPPTRVSLLPDDGLLRYERILFLPFFPFSSFLLPFFFSLFFFFFDRTTRADPVSYSIIMAVLAHVRAAWPPCSLKQWDVTLFSDVPSFRAGEHMRNLIHILAGMKFTTLITPRSAIQAHVHTRTDTLAHAAGVPMFSNFHPASVRQTGTISSIWVKLYPLFATDRARV